MINIAERSAQAKSALIIGQWR